MLDEELVEGLAEQGLHSAALHDAEQAQLAVAGDGDAAGAAVAGGAGRGGSPGFESALEAGGEVDGEGGLAGLGARS